MSGWRTYGLIKRYAYYELVLEYLCILYSRSTLLVLWILVVVLLK